MSSTSSIPAPTDAELLVHLKAIYEKDSSLGAEKVLKHILAENPQWVGKVGLKVRSWWHYAFYTRLHHPCILSESSKYAARTASSVPRPVHQALLHMFRLPRMNTNPSKTPCLQTFSHSVAQSPLDSLYPIVSSGALKSYLSGRTLSKRLMQASSTAMARRRVDLLVT